MVKKNVEIRKYRRLRRKIKLKNRVNPFYWILGKIIPFAIIKFFFKKSYVYITLCLILLVFSSYETQNYQSLKNQKLELKLISKEEQLKQKSTRISNMQDQLLEWAKKNKYLTELNNKSSELLIDRNQTIKQLKKEIYKYDIKTKKNLDDLNKKTYQIETLNGELKLLHEKYDNEISENQGILNFKNNEILMQQSKIKSLENDLKNQKLDFNESIDEIRLEILNLQSQIKDTRIQNSLQILVNFLSQRLLTYF